MAREDIEFMSDGLMLKGHFYTPDNVEPPYPTMVMGGGWCYVKELIQPEYAQHFIDQGIAGLTFDYRNFGESEGEPRQHISPWDQIFDMINATTSPRPARMSRLTGSACGASRMPVATSFRSRPWTGASASSSQSYR